jgi:CARDB
MNDWTRTRRIGANRFLGFALPVLTLTAILFTSMGVQFKSPAFADDPIALISRTISAVDSDEQVDETVITLEFKVINKGAMDYNNVSVSVTSSTDAAADYGTVTVGDLPMGSSRTVTGTFTIPNASIVDMTFRVDHS